MPACSASRSGAADKRFGFGEHLLGRVEIGQVGRQDHHAGAARLDGLTQTGDCGWPVCRRPRYRPAASPGREIARSAPGKARPLIAPSSTSGATIRSWPTRHALVVQCPYGALPMRRLPRPDCGRAAGSCSSSSRPHRETSAAQGRDRVDAPTRDDGLQRCRHARVGPLSAAPSVQYSTSQNAVTSAKISLTD